MFAYLFAKIIQLGIYSVNQKIAEERSQNDGLFCLCQI